MKLVTVIRLCNKLVKLCESGPEDALRAVIESGFGKGTEIASVYDYEKLVAADVKARAAMMSCKNSKGKSLNVIPDLLVVPPALEAKAREILVADIINGTKNTMQGTAEVLVVPQLAGKDKAWFLLDTSRSLKPLIFQERKPPKFVSKTDETDDNVFMDKKFLYGADSRCNVGYGFWQMAYGSDAGRPIDGLGDIYAEKSMDINGSPLNPVARVYPRNYINTGISSIDALTTL